MEGGAVVVDIAVVAMDGKMGMGGIIEDRGVAVEEEERRLLDLDPAMVIRPLD